MLNLDYIFKKYLNELVINNYYYANFQDHSKLDKIIFCFKGIYYCNSRDNAYYFVCQVIDFVPYSGLEDILECKNERLRLRLLHEDNIELVRCNENRPCNVVNNKLSNSPYFINKTETLEYWCEQKPLVAFKYIIHGTTNGYNSILYSCDDIMDYRSSICSNFQRFNTEIENQSFPTTYKRKMYMVDVNNSQPIHNQSHSLIEPPINLSEKYYFIEYQPNKMYNIIKELPLLINPSSLENGCYTYMLLSVISKNTPESIDLYLMKTNTIFELGTKHPGIIKKVSLQEDFEYCKVYLGGEILVDDSRITFNFNSGAYMWNKMSLIDIMYGIPFLENKFKQLIENKEVVFTNKILIYVITIHSFINKLKTPVYEYATSLNIMIFQERPLTTLPFIFETSVEIGLIK